MGKPYELWQVCKYGHWFGYDGENLFKECPICRRTKNINSPMRLAYKTDEWMEDFNRRLKSKIGKKISRSKIIDSLPRLPWFSDALNEGINDPDQKRAGEKWSLKDAEELLNLFEEYGISTYRIWYEIAKSVGRSLYAIERQLRVIIANKECDFDSLFPE